MNAESVAGVVARDNLHGVQVLQQTISPLGFLRGCVHSIQATVYWRRCTVTGARVATLLLGWSALEQQGRADGVTERILTACARWWMD